MEPLLASAECIKRARKDAGFTQLKLAEISGISKTEIGYIEQCRTNPTLDILCILCDVLNVHPSMLFASSINFAKRLGFPTRLILPNSLNSGDAGIFYFNDRGLNFIVLSAEEMRFIINFTALRSYRFNEL